MLDVHEVSAPMGANPFAELLRPVVDRPGSPSGHPHLPLGRVVRLLRDDHPLHPTVPERVKVPPAALPPKVVAPTVPRRVQQRSVQNAALLDLLTSAGDAVSPDAIASALGISEGGVPRAVMNLRSTGVAVVTVRLRGYALKGLASAAKPKAAPPAKTHQVRRVRAGAPPTPDVPALPVYKGPIRAEGEMTYGAAVRLIHKARDGDLVDLDDLERAHWTVAAARKQS